MAVTIWLANRADIIQSSAYPGYLHVDRLSVRVRALELESIAMG